MAKLLTTYSNKLGRERAAHLLRRATFGASRSCIQELARMRPEQALNQLMRRRKAPKPPVDPKTGRSWLPARKPANSYESRLRRYTIFWWLDQLCRDEPSLQERMVYFLHTHFTTMESRANYGSAMYYQLALFRHYALGSFKELATRICSDQAMLMHLDGRYNRRESPNENFAREFLELYSIGKGAQQGPGDYTFYTEHDVKEAAKVFSGFYIDETFSQHIDPVTGLPRGRMLSYPNGEPTQHDFSEKRFSDRFNQRTIRPRGRTYEAVQQEIREFVDMVFQQPETARHICRKLYRFFVYHQITPEVEREIIEPLAEVFRRHDYALAPVLEKLLSSRHFYDAHISAPEKKIMGTMVKSPLELVSQVCHYFEVDLPHRSDWNAFYDLYAILYDKMKKMGMALYEPPSVAGYAAYHQSPDYHRNWISSSVLPHRYIFPDRLLRGIERKGYQQEFRLDAVRFVKSNFSNPRDAEALVRALASELFPRPLPEKRVQHYLRDVLLDGLSLQNWEMEWQHYEKSGQDKGIRRQLNMLITNMLQSPEYQLF